MADGHQPKESRAAPSNPPSGGSSGKPAPEHDRQRIEKLERDLKDALWQITQMQRLGGFTDAKTLSQRCSRIEDRLQPVEISVEALIDVAAFSSTMMEDHLKDRHDADLDRDNSIDTMHWRKVRRRLREMAEKLGLLNKGRDVRGARAEENRLRPSRVQA